MTDVVTAGTDNAFVGAFVFTVISVSTLNVTVVALCIVPFVVSISAGVCAVVVISVVLGVDDILVVSFAIVVKVVEVDTAVCKVFCDLLVAVAIVAGIFVASVDWVVLDVVTSVCCSVVVTFEDSVVDGSVAIVAETVNDCGVEGCDVVIVVAVKTEVAIVDVGVVVVVEIRGSIDIDATLCIDDGGSAVDGTPIKEVITVDDIGVTTFVVVVFDDEVCEFPTSAFVVSAVSVVEGIVEGWTVVVVTSFVDGMVVIREINVLTGAVIVSIVNSVVSGGVVVSTVGTVVNGGSVVCIVDTIVGGYDVLVEVTAVVCGVDIWFVVVTNVENNVVAVIADTAVVVVATIDCIVDGCAVVVMVCVVDGIVIVFAITDVVGIAVLVDIIVVSCGRAVSIVDSVVDGFDVLFVITVDDCELYGWGEVSVEITGVDCRPSKQVFLCFIKHLF